VNWVKSSIVPIITIAFLFSGVGGIMAEMPKLQLVQLGGFVPQADGLRLASGRKGALVVLSKTEKDPVLGANTTFWGRSLADPNARWIELGTSREVVPAQPEWDVATAADGQPEIAFERHGGAINALALLSASGSTEAITAAYPLQSFSGPRFAKSSGQNPRWLTAILDNRTCVALPLTQDSRYRNLGECSAGLLLEIGSGFVFIYKTMLPGAVRGNLISPGRMHVATLDGELRPSGRAPTIFDDTIFEFDADLIRDRLIVLATTPKGMLLASRPTQPTTDRFDTQEYSIPKDLISPAIVRDASGTAALAALDLNGGTRVLIGKIVIP
jgi:hypothetical protein